MREDVEQVLDQPRQMLHLPLHLRADDLGLLGIVAPAQDVQARGQRHDRIAQLVAEHGDELVLVPVGGLQGAGIGFQLVALR